MAAAALSAKAEGPELAAAAMLSIMAWRTSSSLPGTSAGIGRPPGAEGGPPEEEEGAEAPPTPRADAAAAAERRVVRRYGDLPAIFRFFVLDR